MQGWRFTATSDALSPAVFWGIRRDALSEASITAILPAETDAPIINVLGGDTTESANSYTSDLSDHDLDSLPASTT